MFISQVIGVLQGKHLLSVNYSLQAFSLVAVPGYTIMEAISVVIGNVSAVV